MHQDFYYEPKHLQTLARSHIFVLTITMAMAADKILREHQSLLVFWLSLQNTNNLSSIVILLLYTTLSISYVIANLGFSSGCGNLFLSRQRLPRKLHFIPYSRSDALIYINRIQVSKFLSSSLGILLKPVNRHNKPCCCSKPWCDWLPYKI